MLPLYRGGDVFQVGLRVAIAALLALVAALVLDQPWLVTASLLLLGGLYGAQLALEDAPLDAAAALFAAGVLVTAELAYWSLEEREDVKGGPGERSRRLAFVALLGLAAAVVAAVLLVLVDVVRAGGGLAVDVLGAVAAAAVLLAVIMAAGGRARARP